MKAVIQCGGKGTRLRPYTMVLPKPLMPIQSKPVLELLIKWLRRNDIREVYITTGYLSHLIKTFCGDGSQWDMKITYTEEREPLGTVGPIAMLKDQLDSTFMVINGDILTDLSIGAFAACHARSGAMVTVATAQRETVMDYGVIESVDGRMVSFKEKPSFTNQMSMGIYCMEPSVLKHIPCGILFGFDDLALCLLTLGKRLQTFSHAGLWLDIGRVEDFQAAQTLNWDEQVPTHERMEFVA